MAKKYVWATDFKFMYGTNRDKERKELPFQDIDTVMKCYGIMPIYLNSVPLTGHTYLEDNSDKRAQSTNIVDMQLNDGFVEVKTFSGTKYRLIIE